MSRTGEGLDLAVDGAQLSRAAIGQDDLQRLTGALACTPLDRAGVRLHGVSGLNDLLAGSGVVGKVAAEGLGPEARPVRALLLDKSPAANWSLGWHQDRTVVVAERREVDGFGPWSVKAGLIHVAPPVWVLEKMLTLRVHLDPVDHDNAPLMVAPGSHTLGRIPEREIPGVIQRCGRVACLADPGDVWAYATLILHASEAARSPTRRRVLQVDYAVGDLPGGLRWLGV